VDPFQPERNDAASLFEEKYLRKEAGNNDLLLLKVHPMPGKKDVVGSKLLKPFTYIIKKIGEYEFKVEGSGWKWEGSGCAYFWFYTKKDFLPEFYRHYGPPLKDTKHLNAFKKKWGEEKIKEEDGRVYVNIERKYRKVQDYMKHLVKDKYLHENVRKMRLKKITWIM